MPVAGSNKKGYWARLVDGKLVYTRNQREEYSGVCETDLQNAVARLKRGEEVHLYSTYPFIDKVRAAVQDN